MLLLLFFKFFIEAVWRGCDEVVFFAQVKGWESLFDGDELDF